MAFVLSVAKLVDAMKLQGCPVCRRAWQTSNETMEIFLWENVNDPQIRNEIVSAYGFCNYHTRLLAAAELSNTGIPLGVNIIYEQLGRVVGRELEKHVHKGKSEGFFAQLLNRLGFETKKTVGRSVLPEKNICPACKLTNQAVVNTLSTLFETLEKKVVDLTEAYLSSDRLCFDHLRLGLTHYGGRNPYASKLLIDDTVQQINRMSTDMQGYIRKNNWEYRDEKITPEENEAWQKMLVFFTGYPKPVFTFRIPQFDKGEYDSQSGDHPD
jgi:hypothetical protein